MATRRVPKPPKSLAATRQILEKLYAQHPNADTELHFSNAYELLVATILSAQCTDERVNQVTPALFKRYPDARTLSRATTGELEPQIQSTGFFRAKSKSLVGMATGVVTHHNGEIPRTMDELVTLPGVGRKTANVVLGHALGVPGLPVDRHVLRVSNRIGIAKSEDPEIVEQQLTAATEPKDWTRTSDTLILHGRRICKPRPLCDRCAVRDDCLYYRKVLGAVPRGKPKAAGARRSALGAGRARAGRAKPRERSESGTSVELRRGPQGRGTGDGGGAPSHKKK
jgi:endonuclease III